MPWDRSKYPNLKRLEKPDLDLRPEDLECYLINYDANFLELPGHSMSGNLFILGACRAIARLCQEVKRLRGW